MFILNERLRNDTAEVVKLGLCAVLLMNESALPWLILVPERKGIREAHDLLQEDRVRLMEEICLASEIIEALYKPDKINIGALGNIVAQFHVHVLGRFKNDRAWPGPIWGSGTLTPYSEKALNVALNRFKEAFDARSR